MSTDETEIQSARIVDRTAHWLREVHLLAREKGWHDLPAHPRRFQMLGNIPGEVAEAWEEARQKDFAPTRIYYVNEGQKHVDLIAQHAAGIFPKPEGFPVELADVVIRALDTAGALEFNDINDSTVRVARERLHGKNGDLWEQLCQLYQACSRAISEAVYDDSRENMRIALATIVARSEHLAAGQGVDLWAAVDLKHEFNRSRSHRHGGKRA